MHDKTCIKRAFTEINENYILLDNLIKSINKNVINKINKNKLMLNEKISRLDALSPLKTISRGYTISEKDGKIIKTVSQLKIGDKIDLRYNDGKVKANIEDICKID